jgi:hypothetical protein
MERDGGHERLEEIIQSEKVGDVFNSVSAVNKRKHLSSSEIRSADLYNDSVTSIFRSDLKLRLFLTSSFWVITNFGN